MCAQGGEGVALRRLLNRVKKLGKNRLAQLSPVDKLVTQGDPLLLD